MHREPAWREALRIWSGHVEDGHDGFLVSPSHNLHRVVTNFLRRPRKGGGLFCLRSRVWLRGPRWARAEAWLACVLFCESVLPGSQVTQEAGQPGVQPSALERPRTEGATGGLGEALSPLCEHRPSRAFRPVATLLVHTGPSSVGVLGREKLEKMPSCYSGKLFIVSIRFLSCCKPMRETVSLTPTARVPK